MAIRTIGFDELVNDLTRIADKMQSDAIVDSALQAGAQPIYDKMKENTPVLTGALKDSIRMYPIGSKGLGRSIKIGVKYSDMPEGQDAKHTHYANPVEYGHGGPRPAPPHPYVRPAFDTEKENAYESMKETLALALSNA